MTKPDITLEPSKGVVSQMAAQIYAAYITRGTVKEGEEATWMQRSIREAVRIARTVDASIESDDEPDSHQASTAGGNRATAPGSPASPAAAPDGSPAAETVVPSPEDAEFDEVMGEALSEGAESRARH